VPTERRPVVKPSSVKFALDRLVVEFIVRLPIDYCVANCDSIVGRKVKFTTNDVRRFIRDMVGVEPDNRMVMTFVRRLLKVFREGIEAHKLSGRTTYRLVMSVDCLENFTVSTDCADVAIPEGVDIVIPELIEDEHETEERRITKEQLKQLKDLLG